MSSSSDGPTDLNGLFLAFSIQAGIAIGLFTIFSLIRPTYRSLYEPKAKFAPEKKKPKELGPTPLSWIIPTIWSDEKEYLEKIGLDSVIFLRFVNFCLKFFGGILFVNLALTLFHYYAPYITNGEGFEEMKKDTTSNPSLRVLTMRSTNPGSYWFLLYAVLTWVFSIYAFYLLYYLWIEYIALRKKWFKTEQFRDAYHNRTVLITKLPPHMRSEECLEGFIDTMEVPSPIEQIVLARDFGRLPRLVHEHKKITKKMERAIKKYFDSDKVLEEDKRPTHKGSSWIASLSGHKMDSIDIYSHALHHLEEKIYSQRAVGDEHFPVQASAFVSFPDVYSCQQSLLKMRNTMLVFAKTGRLWSPVIKPCPDFKDLIWENLGLQRRDIFVRKLIAVIVTLALTVGWTFILAGIAQLTDVKKMAETNPELSRDIQRSRFAVIFLQSVLAPLILIILNMLVPEFFRRLSWFQGVTSRNGTARSALGKYYLFQIYQATAFVSTKAAFSNVFEAARKNGWSGLATESWRITQAISNGFVDASTFYMTYIVIGYTAYSIELVQGWSLLYNLIRKTFWNPTRRQIYKMEQPPGFSFLRSYGTLLFSFMISSQYSLVAPIVTPFAAMFFGFAYLVLKYQMLYVYETKVESGGSWFPRVFNFICTGIGLFQFATAMSVMVTANMNLNPGRLTALFILLSIPLTFIFWSTARTYLLPQANAMEEVVRPKFVNQLDSHIFAPCIGNPLPKVWIDAKYVDELPRLYQPKYQTTEEFMEINDFNGPHVLEHKRRMHRRLMNFGIRMEEEWECQDHDTERPPELMLTMNMLRVAYKRRSLRDAQREMLEYQNGVIEGQLVALRPSMKHVKVAISLGRDLGKDYEPQWFPGSIPTRKASLNPLETEIPSGFLITPDILKRTTSRTNASYESMWSLGRKGSKEKEPSEHNLSCSISPIAENTVVLSIEPEDTDDHEFYDIYEEYQHSTPRQDPIRRQSDTSTVYSDAPTEIDEI